MDGARYVLAGVRTDATAADGGGDKAADDELPLAGDLDDRSGDHAHTD